MTPMPPLAQLIPHWKQLPEGVQWALNTLLHGLEEQLEGLEPQWHLQLQQTSQRYAQLWGRLIRPEPHSLQHEARRQLIQRLSIFRNLNEFDLSLILEHLEEFRVPAQTNLLTQGQPADGVYWLESGQTQVLVGEELVAHRGPGDCFGEMSCLRGEPNASATVRTMEECVVLRVPREHFMAAVNRAPQLWQNVFLEMTNRFRDINQRLSEVLQHTPQGLVKLDREGKITNEFSTQCVEYLGTHRLMGQAFEAILFQDAEAREGWRQVYPLFFEETMIDFQGVAEILPKEVRFLKEGGEECYYLLSYYACRNPQQEIVAIDVGLQDITRARELGKKSEALEREKQILQKMYDDPEGFLNMLSLAAETLERLESLPAELQAHPEPPPHETLTEVMRLLHTLKGASGMFLLEPLKEASHALEESIRSLEQDARVTAAHLEQLQARGQELMEQIEQARFLIQSMNEELRRRITGLVLTKETFQQLKQAVKDKAAPVLEQLLLSMETLPARKLFQNWPAEIGRISQALGKQVKFKITGENLPIPQNVFYQLDQPLLHLLRNALDHGLEPPAERLESGKSEWGYLIVDLQKQLTRWQLKIKDDGRGLNLPKILEKARNNAHLNQAQVESFAAEGNTWRILFMPGFSTAEEVTDISGRGVGLDAVQATLAELHGEILVESTPGEGTSFILSFPLYEDSSF